MSTQSQSFPQNSNKNLTTTTHLDRIQVERPNNNIVTLDFNTDITRPGLTLFTLPTGSTWSASPHWHESYTEYLRVRQGRITVTLDGVSKTVTPEDGVQVVNKFVLHGWMRADRDLAVKDDEEVVVEEWTDPADGSKQVFFRNLYGTIGDAGRYWKGWTWLQIMLICSVYDNFDPFMSELWPRWVTVVVTHLVFVLVRIVARFVGLRSWYVEYTPTELRDVAAHGTRLDRRYRKGE